jgi:non-heme chloroperoxidase
VISTATLRIGQGPAGSAPPPRSDSSAPYCCVVPAVVIDDEVTLSYSQRGVGGPAVLLLPGPTDSWRSYEPLLDLMPDCLRVVAVSLRGHGDSSKPASGYRIEDLASDVVPLLDALRIDRAVLAGHSGSCLVARRVALDHPSRVAGLFLEASPSTLRGHQDLMRFVDTVVDGLSEPMGPELARSFITETSTDAISPVLLERLVEDLSNVPVAAWREMFGSLSEYDDRADLPRVAAPCSLIWGDADQLVSKEMQDELLDLLPQAELTMYAGVAHTPRWEQPARVARDLSSFTARAFRAPRHHGGPPSHASTGG